MFTTKKNTGTLKPTTLLAVLLSLCINLAQSQVIYVKQDATGNGTSWENALGNLSNALQQATEGTQIWVASGTYYPTTNTDRNISFEISDKVAVYGGFQGTETSIEARHIEANPTILSGEIGKPGIADNSYNVVYTKNVCETTILDGFIIAFGNASGEGTDGSRARCGGGWHNDGSQGGKSTPTIVNCIFKNNNGRDGAGIYNNGIAGESSPTLTNCTFISNESSLDGGAMFNNGRQDGASNPYIENCIFESNSGTYGGAIFNATEDGICNLYMEVCTFKKNTAFLRGGAVFNMNGKEECYLELLDCVYEGNYPDDLNQVYSSNSTKKVYQFSNSNP